MIISNNCPKCKSERTIWLEIPKVFTCLFCANQWSNTNIRSEQFFCQELANSDNWQSVVFEKYPAPIAHEYKQLQTILADGKFVSSMLQLKDVVEVIVKFSTVTMYQWLRMQEKHHYDSNKLNLINSKFLTKPLSLGAWIGLSRELSYLILSGSTINGIDNDSIGIKIAEWLYDYKKQKQGKKEEFEPTQMSVWLAQMTAWRNSEIGHGALRINNTEQFDGFEKMIDKLHMLLSNNNPWKDYALIIDNDSKSDDSDELMGWQSIIQRHDALSPVNTKMHHVEYSKLYLENKNQSEDRVELSPFIEAKVCSYCDLKDIFIFDGVNRNKYFCVDYLSGHRLKLSTSTNDSLQRMLNKKDFIIIDEDVIEDQTLDQDTINESLLNLFEGKSLELGSNFTTPTYLNEQLSDYLENDKHDSGLFWLQAPAHIGKSTFIQGLTNKEIIKQSTVISFHIRREYRYFAHHFTEHLYDEMQKQLSKKGANNPLPRINLLDKDIKPENMLVDWLNEIWIQRPQILANNTLIIAIDGLDEVGRPHNEDFSQLSIIDLLPSKASNELRKGIHIVLTSRPVAECPYWMQSKLNHKLLTSTYQVVIDQHNEGYLNVLRTHFSNNLSGSLKGISTDNRDQIFNTLLNKSKSLFLYFSMLVEQINSQQLSLANINELPLGRKLYGYFIDQLELVLGKQSKGFARIKDIITLLTACEQAFHNDNSIQEESMTVDGEVLSIGYAPSWYGVDAETLAGLLNEPHGAYSSQFIFSLFTIKSLMKVERSSDKAQYAIGLKEFSSYIADRWVHEVSDWHRRLSIQFYEFWQEVGDYKADNKTVTINSDVFENVPVNYHNQDIAENKYLNRYALSHAKLAKEAGVFLDVNYYNLIVENEAIHQFFHHNYTINKINLFVRHALIWLNLEVFCQTNTKMFINKFEFYTADNLKYQVNKIWLKLARNYICRGDLLVYMEQEDDAQINYELASSLCKLEWTGSYDDRLVLLLDSLSKKIIYREDWDYRNELTLDDLNFKIEEYRFYYNRALSYLSSLESHYEIYNSSTTLKKEFKIFKQEIELVEVRGLSQETCISLYAGYENNISFSFVNEVNVEEIYQKYKKIIANDRPDKAFELVTQYFKLSYLAVDIYYDKNSENNINDAVSLMYGFLENLNYAAPLKYRYYTAVLLNAKWSFHTHSSFPKVTKDLNDAAKTLEEGKRLLKESNEFIPSSWNKRLAEIYINISELNFLNQDSIDNGILIDNQNKLIELEKIALKKLEKCYFKDKTESILIKINSKKGEILKLLSYKRNCIKDRATIIELNYYSIDIIRSIIISNVSNNKYTRLRNKILKDYMSCAISFHELDMEKQADLVILDLQSYYKPQIEKEITKNKRVSNWEAFSGYNKFEDEIRQELIGWRESYLDCLRLLTDIDEDDQLDKSKLEQKHRYIVQSRVIIESILVDIDKFADHIKDESYGLSLYKIVGNILDSYYHLFEEQLKNNQSKYGVIDYLHDTSKLIKYIDRYISQALSNIDKIDFIGKKIRIYNSYDVKQKYINLNQYDTLIDNIDMSIKLYEHIDDILLTVNSQELHIARRKSIQSIEEKLKLKIEKADSYIKINDTNASLTLYTECINTYINIIRNLPCELISIEPREYAMKRNSYIRSMYHISIKMYLIDKEYMKVYYDNKYEVKIFILESDDSQTKRFHGLEFISRSSVDYIHKIQKSAYWDNRLFISTLRNEIKNAIDNNVYSKLYLNYVSRLEFIKKWTGEIEKDIANPLYRYYEDDIEGYISIVVLLKAQISYFIDLNLAVKQYSMIENTCDDLLKVDNVDYFLKLKSNLAIEYHPRVENIYKQILDNDKFLIELRASLAIASFGKACAYEVLDGSHLYNYQMAVDSYSRAILELSKINSIILGIDDYGYSNELTHFVIKVHDSRAILYNRLHQLESAKTDYEKVAQLHYATCYSKTMSIEDQVEWFLQGMLFINDSNNGFHVSSTLDISSVEHPLRIFNYPIFEGENIILKLLQLKFDLTILNSDDESLKNDPILLANILHALGNAFVLNAIQNNNLNKLEFLVSPSVYDGDPVLSDYLLAALSQIESAYEFIKIRSAFESHRSNLEVAVKLHTQAISLMTKYGYSYTKIWDYDLNISSQLLEYKDNQSQMFDIPF